MRQPSSFVGWPRRVLILCHLFSKSVWLRRRGKSFCRVSFDTGVEGGLFFVSARWMSRCVIGCTFLEKNQDIAQLCAGEEYPSRWCKAPKNGAAHTDGPMTGSGPSMLPSTVGLMVR